MENKAFGEVFVTNLYPSELRNRMEAFPALYLPVGSVEWHNEHLPLGTDTLHAQRLCRRLCEQTGGAVLPSFWWNTGECHRSDVTYYLPEQYYEETLVNVCLGLQDFKFKLLVLVNGHGGSYQKEFMFSVRDKLNQKNLPFQTICADPYSMGRRCGYTIDHADVIETSLAMELIPEQVRLEREITEDLYSKELPFQSGLPNRKIGHTLWQSFAQEAEQAIRLAMDLAENAGK